MLQGKTVHFLFKTFPFYFHPFLCLLLSSAHTSFVAVGHRPVKCRVPLLNASLSLNPACTLLIRKRCWGLYDSHRIQTLTHESQPLKRWWVRDVNNSLIWAVQLEWWVFLVHFGSIAVGVFQFGWSCKNRLVPPVTDTSSSQIKQRKTVIAQ